MQYVGSQGLSARYLGAKGSGRYRGVIDRALWDGLDVGADLVAPSDLVRLDTAADGVSGFGIYGNHDGTTLRLGIATESVVIGQSTTLFLDTDLDNATGFQIFGWAGGAEYNVNIGADGVPRLYTGGAGQTLVGDVGYTFTNGGQTLEVSIPLATIGDPAQVRIYADVNDTTFLPNDYAAYSYIASGPAIAPAVTAMGLHPDPVTTGQPILATAYATGSPTIAMTLDGAAMTTTSTPPNQLLAAQSWLYQLSGMTSAKRATIASTPSDLIVTDAQTFESTGRFLTSTEVSDMRNGSRLALGYVSIGEAEEYRNTYWDPTWDTTPPAWLGPVNPEWAGNRKVRYWFAEWQTIILDYVASIAAAGWDGIYMDIVDAWSYWETAEPGVRDYRQDMIDFIAAIRAANPGLLIVGQNSTELLTNPAYLDVIDGCGVEDTRFYYPNGEAASFTNTTWYASQLSEMQTAAKAGKAVMAIEYIPPAEYAGAEATLIAAAEDYKSYGWPLYVATAREVDTLYAQPDVPLATDADAPTPHQWTATPASAGAISATVTAGAETATDTATATAAGQYSLTTSGTTFTVYTQGI